MLELKPIDTNYDDCNRRYVAEFTGSMTVQQFIDDEVPLLAEQAGSIILYSRARSSMLTIGTFDNGEVELYIGNRFRNELSKIHIFEVKASGGYGVYSYILVV